MSRGFFDVRYPTPVPKVWVGLILPHRGPGFTPVDFVVDTGASATCLHPAAAFDRVGFTEEEFATLDRVAREDDTLTGITGDASYLVIPARYLLAHEDGIVQEIDGEIRVARPTAGNAGIPSILGWDLLERFRIVIDWRTGEVQLQ